MKKIGIIAFIGLLNIVIVQLVYSNEIKKNKPLEKMTLEELVNVEVYSGNKSYEPLINIPASVTIIQREEIEKKGYLTLDEILRNVPGFYLIDNTESLFIGIRGDLGGGVQILVNGIPEHPSIQKGLHSSEINQLNIPVESIDRIEVIRGPMSVMYGNNAFQGTINIITNEVEKNGAISNVTIGNNGIKKVFLSLKKKFNNGYLVLNAGNYQTDGISGLYSDMLSEEQLQGLHPLANKNIDKQMSRDNDYATISFKYKKLKGDLSYKKMDYGFFPTTVGLGGKNNILLTDKQGSIVYEDSYSNFTNYRITAISSEEQYKIPSMSFITPKTVANQFQTSKRTEIEFNLINKKENYHIISGYRYKEIDNLRNKFFIQISPDQLPIQDFDKHINSITTHELFSQLQYNIAESIKFVAGIRYLRLPEHYHSTIFYESENNMIHENTIIKDRDHYTGRISLMFDINKYNRLKFLIGTAAQDRSIFQFSEPEKITTLEINNLTTFKDFQISLSIFNNKIRRIIQRTLIIDPIAGSYTDVSDNTGKWKTYGFEFIGQFNINDFFHVGSSVTLQNTKDDKYNINVGYSPKQLYKFFAEYSGIKTNYSINGYYVSSMDTGYNLVLQENRINFEKTPKRLGDSTSSYFILNSNFRYSFNSGYYLNVTGSNILDRNYKYPATELTVMKKGLFGMGRIIAFTFGYKY